MTIRYRNGYTVEAILLAAMENWMRVAMKDSDDVVELNRISGAWVTEDCEPVEVAAAWSREEIVPVVSLDDCICPPELASRLLHMLFSGEEDPEIDAAVGGLAQAAPACTTVI